MVHQLLDNGQKRKKKPQKGQSEPNFFLAYRHETSDREKVSGRLHEEETLPERVRVLEFGSDGRIWSNFDFFEKLEIWVSRMEMRLFLCFLCAVELARGCRMKIFRLGTKKPNFYLWWLGGVASPDLIILINFTINSIELLVD